MGIKKQDMRAKNQESDDWNQETRVKIQDIDCQKF